MTGNTLRDTVVAKRRAAKQTSKRLFTKAGEGKSPLAPNKGLYNKGIFFKQLRSQLYILCLPGINYNNWIWDVAVLRWSRWGINHCFSWYLNTLLENVRGHSFFLFFFWVLIDSRQTGKRTKPDYNTSVTQGYSDSRRAWDTHSSTVSSVSGRCTDRSVIHAQKFSSWSFLARQGKARQGRARKHMTRTRPSRSCETA